MTQLQYNLTEIKGIGEETSIQLQEMGIFTVYDLLMNFPYRYEDYSLKDLADAKHDEKVTVQGVVHSAPLLTYYGKQRSRLTFRLLVGRYLINVTLFNQPYLKSKLVLNESVVVSGKWDQHRQMITASVVKMGEQMSQGVEAVYSVRGKLTTKTMKRYVASALKQFENEIEDPLPEGMLSRYKLVSKKEAISSLHLPRSESDLKQARRRMAYEEFLFFQLKMQSLRKVQRENGIGIEKKYDENKMQAFVTSLPFPLTMAQQRVVTEITTELKSPYRMNRLLQGDVGSGKTVVAAISLYATYLSGFQGALMVPTEILAEQHFVSLKQMLGPIGLNVQLLTSSVKGAKRREMLEDLKNGEVHVLVGTHALIQEEVQFHSLGLVVTDEQHRFGVRQRRMLREKGQRPDVLFMTATPIPRTLAITAFGEMDVSIIDEMPAGRKTIETYWAKPEMIERVFGFVEQEMKKGHQAYVICPLIEESEKIDVQNAIEVHSQLSHYFSKRYKVGLMHGRLTNQEKEEVMQGFSKNEVQILVSTTVVEVGVNVPNATMMVIYDAERFGLSQLHQLRGRVGRGSSQSYCVLVANPKSEEGKERMKIMTETNDGFVLSEKDLELRGPGDFFGNKQSGIPEFKVGDMIHDFKILETARQDAASLIASDAFWKDDCYRYLRASIKESGVLDGEKID